MSKKPEKISKHAEIMDAVARLTDVMKDIFAQITYLRDYNKDTRTSLSDAITKLERHVEGKSGLRLLDEDDNETAPPVEAMPAPADMIRMARVLRNEIPAVGAIAKNQRAELRRFLARVADGVHFEIDINDITTDDAAIAGRCAAFLQQQKGFATMPDEMRIPMTRVMLSVARQYDYIDRTI